MTLNNSSKYQLKIIILPILFFFVSLTLSLSTSAHKVYIPDTGGSFSCMINAAKICSYPIPHYGTGTSVNVYKICFAENNQS